MAFARQVEDLGYHTLVMPDHFGARFALAPALVLAAEATSRLRVGSLVYDNDFQPADLRGPANQRWYVPAAGAGWKPDDPDGAKTFTHNGTNAPA